MARTYMEDLDGLPVGATHNWALLKQLEELVKPYATPRAYFRWSAKDSRGTYETATIDELRAEAEKQVEPPDTIILQLLGDAQNFLLLLERGGKSGGHVHGKDEAFVLHVSTRIRRLLAIANAPPSAREPGASFPVPERQEEEWRTVYPEPEQGPVPKPLTKLRRIEPTAVSHDRPAMPDVQRRTRFWERPGFKIVLEVLGVILAALAIIVAILLA